MKHPSDEQLILHYYGEGDDGPSVSEHLQTCAPCRGNFQSVRQLLDLVEGTPVPERSESYGTEVWQRLQPRLPQKGRWHGNELFGLFRSFTFPRWASATGVGLLILGAFLAGRFWSRPAVEQSGPVLAYSSEAISAQGRERILLSEIAGHLERSQLALIELIHSRTNVTVDISAEQALARQLVEVNRLYRQTAERIGEAGMASVLDDLERTLIEIAQSPPQLSAEEMEELQQRFAADDLLFKVKILSAQVREKEKETARTLAGTGS